MIFCFIVMPCTAQLQDDTGITLYGTVSDASTQKPMFFVNVFIANTLIGATTDKKGFYELNNIPLGKHEFVFSMIGYETQTLELNILTRGKYNYDCSLSPTTLEMPEIKIEAFRPKVWDKYLQRFEKEFLGTTKNAKRCEIINPEVLDFSISEEYDLFKATAQAPLEIINRALGYRILVLLKSFTINQNRSKFDMITRFEELVPENNKEQRKWTENRMKVYLGSYRHFMDALLDLQLEEEYFVVTRIETVMKNTAMERLIESGYQLQVKNASQTLFSRDEKSPKILLHFSGILKIEYLKEIDDIWFKNTQISFLECLKDTIYVYRFGYKTDYDAMQKSGYWYYIRLADELPYDFNPDILK